VVNLENRISSLVKLAVKGGDSPALLFLNLKMNERASIRVLYANRTCPARAIILARINYNNKAVVFFPMWSEW
jgi:hypothetical protein